jgi:hypothetical protein
LKYKKRECKIAQRAAMFQVLVGVKVCITRLNVAFFQVDIAVFQQNMHLLATESGEHQQREEKSLGVESGCMDSAFFQFYCQIKGAI